MDIKDLKQYSSFAIDFLEPIVRATENPENARALISELGYEVPSDITAFNELGHLLDDIFNLITSIDGLVANQSTDKTRNEQILLELLIKTGEAFGHLNNFRNKIQDNFAGTDLLSQTNILNDLPVKLLDTLFISYLEKHLGEVHSILLFVGIIEEEYIDGLPPHSGFHQIKKIRWDKIPELFTDPVKILKESFVDGNVVKFDKLIFLLEQVGVTLGLLAEVNLPDIDKLNAFNSSDLSTLPILDNVRYLRFPLISDPHAELAVEVFPVLNAQNTAYEAIGAALIFGSQIEIPLSENFLLKINISAALQDSLGITISSNGEFHFKNNVLSLPQLLSDSTQINILASVESIDDSDSGNFLDIGAPGGSKLTIGSGSLSFGLEKKGNDANFFIEQNLKDGLLLIALGDSDGFIGSILSDSKDLSAAFDLGIGFSNKNGLYFKGGSLEIALPTHISLGPIEILQIALGLKIQDQNFINYFSTTFNAQLGPLTVVVENIGIQSNIVIKSDRTGNLGPLDLAFGFKPPNGLGLSINAGAVIGGGYLFFDLEREEYAGVMELTIAGFISAKAIGLITTKMPDGSKGFSMLVIITAEFNPAFQLGYGFTLIGVGGLLGLNRTVLLDPLREGVRTGAVNSIMFPQNVIANAPRIISDLKAIFPPYEGRFLVGPMGKLGWGTPTLISLSLGIIIEIPGNIAILGVLKIALPEERIPLVQIQVAFVGTIDFDKKMITFDASLYESFILTMPLEGDMAMRLKWGDNPDFILTVGGFHPSFTPPPLALPTLRRLAINILNTEVSKIRVECYQAVTSNTVQFGAKAELYFGFSQIEVQGHIAFDALFQFSPFYFIIEVSASASLKVFGMGVFSIRLRFSLEGPTPWRAKGTGSISFFFFDVSADFDITWGDSRNTALPDIEILPRFIEEIKKPEQWSTVLSGSQNLLVSLRKFEETEGPLPLVLHPSGALEIRQKLLPLTVKIDKIGNQKTSDVQNVSISAASSNGTPLRVDAVDEFFASAQYQNMSDAEKLSKPSFVKMPGGVGLSMDDGNVKNGKLIRKVVEYEVTIIDKEPKKAPKGKLTRISGTIFTHFLKGNSVSKSALSRSRFIQMQPKKEKLNVLEEGFTLAFQDNNKAFDLKSTFKSEMEAQTYMQEQIRKNPNLKKDVHVISAFELQES